MAIYWSVAQLGLNFWAIYRLYTKPLDTEHVFGDKQLVARVLQREVACTSLHRLHQLLLGGSLLPPPVWDYLEPGEHIPVDRPALLCNGSAVVALTRQIIRLQGALYCHSTSSPSWTRCPRRRSPSPRVSW